MKDIVSKLNDIYYSKINNMDINLSNKEIIFDLSTIDGNLVTNHMLKILGCSSVLWSEKRKDDVCYNYKECDYYELSSIILKKISVASGNEWLNQYPMEYSVVIEIWESALLIKAEEIILDGQKFLIS